MTQLKDVLHFYIGQQVHESFNDRAVKMVGINTEDDMPVKCIFKGTDWSFKYEEIKPILRRLSSMTEDEFNECLKSHPKNGLARWQMIGKIDEGGAVDFDTWSPYTTAYLLSKGFDLFNLIDSNQAIEHGKDSK